MVFQKTLFLQALVIFTGFLATSNSFSWGSLNQQRQPRLLMRRAGGGGGAPEETFFASLEEAFRSLGLKHGLNRAVPALNQGRFKAVPLFGRLKEVTTNPTTIAALTFNSFPELTESLGPLELLQDGAFVFKGDQRSDHSPHHFHASATSPSNLYAVQSPFKILSRPKEERKSISLVDDSEGGGDDDHHGPKKEWAPTSGVCTVIGSFDLNEDGTRLGISLERVEVCRVIISSCKPRYAF